MAEQGTAQAPVAAMTEAGFSMNVKMIDKFGQEVMLTFRAPQVNQAQTLLAHYENVVQHLIDKSGWAVAKQSAKPAEAPATNGGTPTCRVHNVTMKPSKHGGGFYCPRKEGENWCKEKAS